MTYLSGCFGDITADFEVSLEFQDIPYSAKFLPGLPGLIWCWCVALHTGSVRLTKVRWSWYLTQCYLLYSVWVANSQYPSHLAGKVPDLVALYYHQFSCNSCGLCQDMEHRLGAALRSGSSVLTVVVSDNTAIPLGPPGGRRPPAHRRC